MPLKRDKRLEPLSKYKSYSEKDILENLSAKHPTGETLEDDLYYNMPEIRGVPPEGLKEPLEIKTGGLIKGKPKIALRGWK